MFQALRDLFSQHGTRELKEADCIKLPFYPIFSKEWLVTPPLWYATHIDQKVEAEVVVVESVGQVVPILFVERYFAELAKIVALAERLAENIFRRDPLC